MKYHELVKLIKIAVFPDPGYSDPDLASLDYPVLRTFKNPDLKNPEMDRNEFFSFFFSYDMA